jgi:pectinesterase
MTRHPVIVHPLVLMAFTVLTFTAFLQAENAKTRVVLAGDSTVTDNAGWGATFAAMLSDKAECINLSKGGRSSGSFVAEGLWQQVLDLKPDFVLIQFGHNDEPGHGPERETDPNTTYAANMLRYVDEARAAGIEPILVTPLCRRQWGPGNRIHSSLLPYARTVKRIAAEKKVNLIDLHDRSIEVYESLGRDGCKLISPTKENGQLDGTHLNAAGSHLFGSLVAAEAKVSMPGLGSFFPTSKLMALQQNAIVPRAPVDKTWVQSMMQPAADSLTSQGTQTLIVAADGEGTFASIQAAVNAVPNNNADHTIIHIKPGIYIGPVIVPPCKTNVTFQGDEAGTCILSYALNVHDPIPANTLPGMQGNSVIVLADGFHARNLTFRNTSGDHGQAMALRLEGDQAVIQDCLILGWQDTLLVNNGRHYFKNCTIEGRVDFIYGSATAVFDDCEIRTKLQSYITAASTPRERDFGFVFRHCHITSPDGGLSYLGRPWRPYASVTYLNCEMGGHIRPEGWNNWRNPENEKTARYAEYHSTGPGARPKMRVEWSHQLTEEQAKQFNLDRIFQGWRPIP